MKWHAQTVEIPSDRGTLQGEILLPRSDGPFPAAVLCHGIASGHSAMTPCAQRLVRRGIATLTFDFRGHGLSEGVLNSDLAEDVIAAVEFTRRQACIDPHRIALVGHSMGAMAAIHAATTLEDIQALVSLSTPALISGDLSRMWAPLYPKAARAGTTIVEFPHIGGLPMLGRLPGMLSRLWMWVQGYRLRINLEQSLEQGLDSWEKLNPLTNIEKVGSLPKLFVYCKGDRLIPYESTLNLYDKAVPPKEFFLSRGGFHAAPLFPGRLRGRWISWLVSVLT